MGEGLDPKYDDFSDLWDPSFDAFLNPELWPHPSAAADEERNATFARDRSGLACGAHQSIDSDRALGELSLVRTNGNASIPTCTMTGQTILDATLASTIPRCIDCHLAQYLNEHGRCLVCQHYHDSTGTRQARLEPLAFYMSQNSSSSSLGSIGSFDSVNSAASAGRRRGKRIQRGYSCQYPGCDKVFDVPSKMRHHERNHIHREDRPHSCEACNERFLFPKDLRRHSARIHATDLQRSTSDASDSPSMHRLLPTSTELPGFEKPMVAEENLIDKTTSNQSSANEGKRRFRWKPRLPPIPRDPGGRI